MGTVQHIYRPVSVEHHRCEQEGISSGGEWFKFGRSSPSQHCPQKAVVVHARMAASKLELGSRLS